ncbi:MAG: hypothetical protein GY861_10990 [bacterium]|nr:hypothetical protein [bacterium]
MQELIDKILFAMGISEEDIPLEVITYYLEQWLEIYPDNECLALHNTVLSLYDWLIKDASKNASGGGNRKEKVGNVQVEVGATNKSQDWQDAKDAYLESPWTAFPSCRDELGKGVAGRVIVGGVREDSIDAVNCNDNIRTGGASEVCGVRQPSPYRKLLTRRGRNWTIGRRCR